MNTPTKTPHDATTTLPHGTERLPGLLGWDTFAAVQAMNGDHKPSAADQAIINGLIQRAAAAHLASM